MSAATMAGGLDPAAPLRGIPAALEIMDAAPVARVAVEKTRARLALNSEPTHTYDSHGNFPTLRLFQIARQLPEYRPFGSLAVDPGPGGRASLLSRSYGRASREKPQFIDRLL